ncbi:1-(5-phosphoribosyl)-5-[(5-phosphoribosylamino)methylideneamino] imidazole-4-carboxamide isomerase [Sphingomonas ginkgonis]|uniref:1-(5-phosphoribosyl)-5-[(5-phosphoribosylamino)methylideneamino] imidazole-4-carboxamide isomerase n=1 Tax=Sphingomonas ginkgonis TaxID=2315330 RepID=A0A3R9YGM5_9SPHN|nr:1-(5-phosphoribosyl)-5-[(5-phosphoribosylamino)methylideneamino] imidazole-4-carboxamide isomerase [Sphingomonas ginkgonis]RST29496.1 1-(5-phosphoribosyl)-5-[(5-phosphoribosylamino)methylideneamino] imidazole-4-carboxamide isomerase [Sphingomonas ginkgonis]
MILYPAMDLMGGSAVRLRQGRFDDRTTYSAEPIAALRGFAEADATWAHIVDLDGARAGEPRQHDLIADLARAAPLKLQVAGGFRTRDQLARMVDAGVGRVVIGSLAVKQPDTVAAWIDEFGPERITLSLDVRMAGGNPMVAVSGWTEDTGLSLWDVAARFPTAVHLLLTDIGLDGMLQGPNFALYEEVARRLPQLKVQASGGVTSLNDLRRLRTDGAIVGKALWEGQLDLAEALGLARA